MTAPKHEATAVAPASQPTPSRDEMIEEAWHGVPGESFVVFKAWPGYLMVGLAVLLVGFWDVAVENGFRGWSIITSVLIVVLAVGGFAVAIYLHNKMRSERLARIHEQYGVAHR